MSHLHDRPRTADPDVEDLGMRAMAVDCIWVVDDDPSVGRALVRMIRSLDIDCVLCPSAADLLDRIGSAQPTFVLLDIHMPHTSGVDALRAMRARGINVPAVMMTGVERDGTRETCIGAGAAEVLAKPVQAATITALLARFASRQSEGPFR